MSKKLLSTLIASLFAAVPAFAQSDDPMRVEGSATLGGIYNVSFRDCVFEGEQGVVVLSRDQGNATRSGPGALADITLDNCSVIVGVFGNATRPGVHDLRPIDSGSPEKSAEPQADVPGLSFESAAGVAVRGGSVSFVGPHQPFWAPGATCWTATPDSSVEVDAAFVCSPGERANNNS